MRRTALASESVVAQFSCECECESSAELTRLRLQGYASTAKTIAVRLSSILPPALGTRQQ